MGSWRTPSGPSCAGTRRRPERDEEIRQLAALAQPAVDPGLRNEVRDMVVASNVRRVRAGREPLDVESEVQRRIRDLS